MKGGKLVITAGEIEDESSTTMTVRVDYQTKDGPRTTGMNIDLTLFPKE